MNKVLHQDVKDLAYYLLNRKKDLEMLTISQYKRYTSGKFVFNELKAEFGEQFIRTSFVSSLECITDGKAMVWDYFNFVKTNEIATKYNCSTKSITRRVSLFSSKFIERIENVRALHQKN